MSIENKEISISLKMAWTIVGALVFFTFSVAGFYFGLAISIKDVKFENQLQALQYQNLYLNVQKIEIELKEMQKQINSKNHEADTNK